MLWVRAHIAHGRDQTRLVHRGGGEAALERVPGPELFIDDVRVAMRARRLASGGRAKWRSALSAFARIPIRSELCRQRAATHLGRECSA